MLNRLEGSENLHVGKEEGKSIPRITAGFTAPEITLQTWAEFEAYAKKTGQTDIHGGKAESPWPRLGTTEKTVRIWPNPYREFDYFDILNPDRE